ncbi:HlyD family efflux transporter periplasmic adaptor subunit [Neobacillus sp. FSL H8-0543]|uniref:efflux RND transporter periplasmic adaptor subunit n=1 Tax=Neobacillus sp. FSL H8-0543 TaxID=2954672 RepID=UPI00315916CB
MKKKKLWIWIGSVVGVLVLGVAATITFGMFNKNVNVTGDELNEMGVTVQKASEQELIESILVTGQIVPESEQKVFLEPEKGVISEYKVTENQTVKAGEPLFVYDSSKLEVELSRAKRENELIESRGKTEQSQISELNKRMADMKKKMETQKTSTVHIESEGAEEPKEPQVTQEDLNQLTNEKIQLEMQYENTKAEISSASEQITEITTRIKDMTVVSKIDGIIVKINQNIANTETGSNESVVHIISSQPYKVIGTMSEFDAVKIKQGQAVVVRPKVFKDREWKGSVESVSQFPNEAGGGGEEFGGMGGGSVTMYPFKVAITDDTSELRQGFHVSLEIKIGGGEKHLVVPHMALIDQEGMSVAYVLTDGKLERREVKKGSMNDEFIEITEGVNLGELVVITPNDGMHDGMEVTSFDEVD